MIFYEIEALFVEYGYTMDEASRMLHNCKDFKVDPMLLPRYVLECIFKNALQNDSVNR